ncbi:MAG TPA: cyclodeaminase/cyclohydrolase family protein [Solirubrobacteraceae bacterium]
MQGEAIPGDWTVRELLDALAERTPAPGGGAAAACAGAVGAALIEMAARFSLAQGDVGTPMADVLERAGELRARLLELGEVELRAFAPVLAAQRLPRDDPERAARLRSARSSAAQSPFEIAGATAELAELAAELSRTGNPNLEGDAVTGCLLAEAACRAAARLVEINLPDGEEDLRVRRAEDLSRRALVARDRALRG